MLYPDINLQKRTQQNTTRYRTALYLRLSREDGDKTESDSIANQRTLLEAYTADHPELCIVDEFVDDGYSGSNFDRPEFERLLKALQERKVNCIVVKDFSRLGRNFVETGQYLEQVFPLFGVRVIAIKAMVRCIFTVHLAMFQFQRKTSGMALTRSCTSGWKNTVICRSWYGKALEKANSNQKK